MKRVQLHKIGLEHQYGRRDVVWSYVIGALQIQLSVDGFLILGKFTTLR